MPIYSDLMQNIYWVAALLDGEGSFEFANTPVISLQMGDEDTVRKFYQLTKATTFVYRLKKRQSHHKEMHRVSICGYLAIQWMLTIYPLMSSRRKERIREIVGKWKQMSSRTRYGTGKYVGLRYVGMS